MADWKFYVDKKTIGMLWDGTASMPELNDALKHKKEYHREFYTSVIAPALLLDELERTSLPKAAAAEKEFHKLFVRAKAPIKLISVHQLVSAKRSKWAAKARGYVPKLPSRLKFELPFETAIELATAEFARARFYITSIDDEEELAAFAAFVEDAIPQLSVIRPSAIPHEVQRDFDLDSSEGDPGSPSTSLSGLLGPKRNPSA